MRQFQPTRCSSIALSAMFYYNGAIRIRGWAKAVYLVCLAGVPSAMRPLSPVSSESCVRSWSFESRIWR